MAVSVAEPGARDRVERWLLRSVALLRVAQYGSSAPAVAVIAVTAHTAASATVVASYLLGLTWSAWMFAGLLRHDRVPTWVAAMDVLVICAVQTALPLALGADRTVWVDWTYGPAIGATVLVLVSLGRGSWWLAALPIVSWAAIPFIGRTPAPRWPDLVGGVVGMIAFAALAAFAARSFRRFAKTVPRPPIDSALSTLQMIAGGGLDLRADDVRRRCQQDADSLRGLLMSERGDPFSDLTVALTEVVRDRSLLGLRVHPLFDTLPPDVPDNVAAAFVAAAREALTNAAHHARVEEAWFTAVGTPEKGVSVTIVDRGKGSAPDSAVVDAIAATMTKIGGHSVVDSVPGEGTTVELTWTP
ncbi:MAG TPA: hypothetical protein VM677_32850 [Actinokineospora sp.]|nr:hypothetical protein [Actinokineospora sp.]